MYDIMVSAHKKDFIPTDDEINTINSFMMCRWMSNNINTVEFANFINCNTDMPLKGQYWLARAVMNSVGYITRLQKEDQMSELEQAISFNYDVDFDVAKEYAKMLPDNKKEEILATFRGGKI